MAHADRDRNRDWSGLSGAGVGHRPHRLLQDGRAQDLRLSRAHHGRPGVGAPRHRAGQHRRQQHQAPGSAGGALAMAARGARETARLPGARAGEGRRLRRLVHRAAAGVVPDRRHHMDRGRIGPCAGGVGGARGQCRVHGRRDGRRRGPRGHAGRRRAARRPAVCGRPGVRSAAWRHPAVRRPDRRGGGRGSQLHHLRRRRAGQAVCPVRATSACPRCPSPRRCWRGPCRWTRSGARTGP